MDYFDLREASADLWPFVRHDRRVLGVVLAFLLAFSVFLVIVSAPAILDHRFGAIQAATLTVLLGVALAGSGVLISSIVHRRQGAVELRMDGQGFELTYPDGKRASVVWSNPGLRFDLMDLSGVNPAKLRSRFPYSITIRGVRSLLTQEAFLAVQREVGHRGLIDTTSRGPHWAYADDANPVTYRVRGSLKGRQTL